VQGISYPHDGQPPPEALGLVLDAAENASPLEAVEAVTGALAAALNASAAFFLIADLSGRGLVRLSHVAAGAAASGLGSIGEDAADRFDAGEQADVLPFSGGPAEEAVRTQTVQVVAPPPPTMGGGRGRNWVVLAPVTERGEVLGLLELTLPEEPPPDVLSQISRIAHVLSFVIIANRRHTDLFEWGQRTAPFTLPAEIQRRLLPAAFTCEAAPFILSAWLEPAASIGGDTFDYCLGRDVLHLSVTDAMGHGVASALNATLCVGSLRNTRRRGGSLIDQAAAANQALFEHAASTGTEGFATGLLGRLDLRTGILEMVNAGHVDPYLLRDGEVNEVPLVVNLPLGMFADTVYRGTNLTLQTGDRLVLLTDGMLERGAATVDVIAEIAKSRHLHPREVTRRLTDKILEVTGAALADDATLLVLDWYDEHGRRERATVSGAEPLHASAAGSGSPPGGG
jgi:serine phosphatase RsbU (regulator of sigma subunit)